MFPTVLTILALYHDSNLAKAKIQDRIDRVKAQLATLEKPEPDNFTSGCPYPLDFLLPVSDALMGARLDPGAQIVDACVTSPDSKYLGAENQLYRVEVHRGGVADEATFKWSRDNASVATAWIGSSGHELEVADARGLAAGNWVELSDDNAELRGLSGVLARVTKVEGGTLSVSAMRFLPEKSRHMLVIEQYMLTACLKYHRTQRQSPYSGIEIRHVFATLDEALSPHGPRRAGFTHLAAGAKRNRRVSRDLENRVRRELPEFYEHSTNLLQAAL